MRARKKNPEASHSEKINLNIATATFSQRTKFWIYQFVLCLSNIKRFADDEFYVAEWMKIVCDRTKKTLLERGNKYW